MPRPGGRRWPSTGMRSPTTNCAGCSAWAVTRCFQAPREGQRLLDQAAGHGRLFAFLRGTALQQALLPRSAGAPPRHRPGRPGAGGGRSRCRPWHRPGLAPTGAHPRLSCPSFSTSSYGTPASTPHPYLQLSDGVSRPATGAGPARRPQLIAAAPGPCPLLAAPPRFSGTTPAPWSPTPRATCADPAG